MGRNHRMLLLAVLAVLLVACSQPPASGPAGRPQNALVIRMLYGSEKQAWIDAVTADFNAQHQQSKSGRPIVVDAVPMGSADALERILSGQERPAIWSPASSILLPVANQRWSAAHNGAKLVTDSPSVVLSPVVIAMWKPMAQALGWPAKRIGWGDIAELMRSGKTWKDFGHPEWGAFQFGHTHPDYSNSGITSILAEVYAATGKTRGLTVADVQKPAVGHFVADVERAVIHYGESTGFFGSQMFSRGPAYLSGAVLYENLVVESYDTAKYPNRPLPVVAIYPKEGTFWSDHPFAVLNAPWVDDEMRAAAQTYRAFLLARPQQERALQLGFRPADPNVPIGAPIVADKGVDPAEPKTLLEVPANPDVLDAVRQVWGQNKKHVEVQIVLDTSGSMQNEQRLEQAKTAIKQFVDHLSDQDSLGVVTFSTEKSELTPLGELGPKRADVLNKIGALFPNGDTRLIDTTREVYQQMQQRPHGDRIRAMIVLSDGADNKSSGSAADLKQLLAADESGTSIKVFTIAYGTGSDVDVGLMKAIAESSGAKSYQSAPTSIDQIYRDIATFF